MSLGEPRSSWRRHMPRPDHGPSLLADILHSDLFAQLAPILVLLLVPALALLATSNLDMGLDSIGLGLSSFFSSSKPSPPLEHSSDRKHRRHTRTRTDQRAQNGTPLRGQSQLFSHTIPSLTRSRPRRWLLPRPRQHLGHLLFHECYPPGQFRHQLPSALEYSLLHRHWHL